MSIQSIRAQFGLVEEEEDKKDREPAGSSRISEIRAQFLDEPETPAASQNPEPALAPERPSLLQRSRDRMQLGFADAFSTMAGDSYGRSGDPTERDNLPIGPGPQEALIRGTNPFKGNRMMAAGADVLSATGDVVGDFVSEAVPDDVKKGLSKTVNWMKGNLEGGIYENSDPIGEIYRQAEAIGGPEVRRSAEEASMIGSLAAPAALTKTLRALPGGDSVADIGTDMQGRLARTKEAMRRKDVERRWEPDDSNASGRATTNRLSRNEYRPTDYENQVFDEVMEVENLDPRAPFVDNFNALTQKTEKLRADLDKKLQTSPRVDAEIVVDSVADARDALLKNDVLQGDASAIGKVIFDRFQELLNEQTYAGVVRPGDLLQIRRDLDSWVAGKRGSAFDGAALNAQQTALKAIRDQINEIVANTANDVDVRSSLRRQSNLLTARDRIEKQTIAEPKTPAGRFVTDVERATGLASAQTPLAAIANAQNPMAMALAAGGSLYARGGRAAGNMARFGDAATQQALRGGILASRGPLSVAQMNALVEEMRSEDEEPMVPYRR